MAGDKLRVGIIGVGWGALVHVPAFRATGAFDVVAISSRRPERLAKAGEKLGINDLVPDWKDLVKRDDIDMVSIASPVDLHKEMTLAAAQAGKHILCEKPAAMTARDAREMLDAAEQAGVGHLCCFEKRWLPDYMAVRNKVAEGVVGDPYSLRILQSGPMWHPTHKPQSDWMYRRAEGGGYLSGMLSHDIDYACALLGQPVAVAADVHNHLKTAKYEDGHEVQVDADDTTTVLIRFESGATAVISCSVVGAHTHGMKMDLFGANGTVVFESGRTDQTEIRAGSVADAGLSPVAPDAREPKAGAVPAIGRSSRMVRATALMLEDWLPNKTGSNKLVPTLEAGWRVQQVIEAAQKSSAGAGWVKLSDLT